VIVEIHLKKLHVETLFHTNINAHTHTHRRMFLFGRRFCVFNLPLRTDTRYHEFPVFAYYTILRKKRIFPTKKTGHRGPVDTSSLLGKIDLLLLSIIIHSPRPHFWKAKNSLKSVKHVFDLTHRPLRIGLEWNKRMRK